MLPKIEGDIAAVVASNLVQAHASISGGILAGRKAGSPLYTKPIDTVEKLYEHYYVLVTTGARPVKPEAADTDG